MAFRPDDLIAELEGVAMRTSQGTYVRLDDVKRLTDKYKEVAPDPRDEPAPKNLIEARGQAKRFLESENGPRPQQVGRALPATEPQSASRP